MKATYYPIIRIVFTLIVGIFMIISPSSILSYIAIIIGLLLLIPGIVQLLRYAIIRFQRNHRDRRNSSIKFPVLPTACAVTGILIIVFWKEVVKIFSIVLASSLLLAGIYEIMMIARSANRNKLGYYVLPALLTLLGVFILINPLDLLPNVIVIMFGVGAIIYCINEIIYLARIGK
ncbi:MAG: DUF308 domain-containing protein [Bacteroidaceae bacterium]|nr:DUF308 domain-containing protein [Bacteroidaceae bacterium]